MKTIVVDGTGYPNTEGVPASLFSRALEELGKAHPGLGMNQIGDALALVMGNTERAPDLRIAHHGKIWSLLRLNRGEQFVLRRKGVPDLMIGLTPMGTLLWGGAGVPIVDPVHKRMPPEVVKWLTHGERGRSSEAICRALYGVPDGTEVGWPHPLDPSDFRRCEDFLSAVPQARARLHEMAGKSPIWGAMVAAWVELEMLLNMEIGQSTAPKLYERMKAIQRDARSDQPLPA